MLKIRAEQFQALAADVRERADRELAKYVRGRFPRLLGPKADADVIALVVRVRGTAQSYGIVREDNVATFLDLSVMYGEEFHRDPWAADVLNLENWHGPDRMWLLRHKVKMTNVVL
jgi:hypothetical protein